MPDDAPVNYYCLLFHFIFFHFIFFLSAGDTFFFSAQIPVLRHGPSHPARIPV